MKSESVLVLAVMVLLAASASAGTYSGGDGSAEDPYRIATPNDLNDIGNHVEDFNKCFIMVNDINLAAYTGTEFKMIGSSSEHFIGVFDGNGHTIFSFAYQTNGSGIGLFCRVGNSFSATGKIKNLTLVDPNVDAGTGDGVGALVGALDSGTISACSVQNGRVRGSSGVGGLIGGTTGIYSTKIITDCCSTATVSGSGGVGGLAGGFCATKGEATMLDCSSMGSVSGNTGVGGLVGSLEGYISRCHSSAIVSGEDSVGGLIGWAQSQPYYLTQIIDCSADGNVTATGDNIGGLVGSNDEAYIADCCGAGDVEGASIVGGLIGYNYDARIVNCYATGNVRTEWGHGGGLVGRSGGYRAIISDCFSTGTVSATPGSFCLGGLVGDNFEDATITDSFATGDVNGLGLDDAGGLAGRNESGIITSCYANGSVSGFHYVAGLVGENLGTIIKCFAQGSVDGNDRVGGLTAENEGEVVNCYASGIIVGDILVGGLIGVNKGTVTNCYARGSVSGDDLAGAFVGGHYNGSYMKCFWETDVNPDVNGIGNTNDPNVIGMTTEEMQTESTFTDAGWDFVEVWGIGENQTYPFLRVYPAGDIDHDGKVNFLDVAILADHWLEGAVP